MNEILRPPQIEALFPCPRLVTLRDKIVISSFILDCIHTFTRCQFYQQFMCGFFVRNFFAKLFCTYILGLKLFLLKKIGANALIFLVKLTLEVLLQMYNSKNRVRHHRVWKSKFNFLSFC